MLLHLIAATAYFLLSQAIAQNVSEPVDCGPLLFQTSHDSQLCVPVTKKEVDYPDMIGDSSLKLYRNIDYFQQHPNTSLSMLARVVNGAKSALLAYESWSTPLNVSILLTGELRGIGNYIGETNSTEDGSACGIVVSLPDSKIRSSPEVYSIEALIASQVYNCVQFRRTPPLSRIADDDGSVWITTPPLLSWHLKGGASFMGFSLFPSRASARLSQMSRYNPSAPLYEQIGGYPASLFFNHLVNSVGWSRNELNQWLAGLPFQNDDHAMRNALNNDYRIPDAFVDFMKHISDGTLQFPNNTSVKLENTIELDFPDLASQYSYRRYLNMSTYSFTAKRNLTLFPRGATIVLSLVKSQSDNSSASSFNRDITVLYRPYDEVGATWRQVPSSGAVTGLSVGCRDPEMYEFMVINTGRSAKAETSIRLSFAGNERGCDSDQASSGVASNDELSSSSREVPATNRRRVRK